MEQNQEQQKQKLLNAYNTYANARAAARLGGLMGKLALQLGARAVTAIAVSPVGWIAVGIGIVVLSTFLIVFSTGAPSLFPITPNPLSPTPTIEPTSTESP